MAPVTLATLVGNHRPVIWYGQINTASSLMPCRGVCGGTGGPDVIWTFRGYDGMTCSAFKLIKNHCGGSQSEDKHVPILQTLKHNAMSFVHSFTRTNGPWISVTWFEINKGSVDAQRGCRDRLTSAAVS